MAQQYYMNSSRCTYRVQSVDMEKEAMKYNILT